MLLLNFINKFWTLVTSIVSAVKEIKPTCIDVKTHCPALMIRFKSSRIAHLVKEYNHEDTTGVTFCGKSGSVGIKDEGLDTCKSCSSLLP